MACTIGFRSPGGMLPVQCSAAVVFLFLPAGRPAEVDPGPSAAPALVLSFALIVVELAGDYDLSLGGAIDKR